MSEKSKLCTAFFFLMLACVGGIIYVMVNA